MRRVSNHHSVVGQVGRQLSTTKPRSSRFQRPSDSEGSVAASSLLGSKVIIEDTFDGAEEPHQPDPSFGQRVVDIEAAAASGFGAPPKSRFVAGKGDDMKITTGGREVVVDSANLWQSIGKKGVTHTHAAPSPKADDPDARATEQLMKGVEAKSTASSNSQRASTKSDMERILACSLRGYYGTVNPTKQSEEQLAATPCPMGALIEFSADMRKAYRQTGKQTVIDHYFQEISAFFVTLVVPRVSISNGTARSESAAPPEDVSDEALLSSEHSGKKGAWDVITSRTQSHAVQYILGGDTAHTQHCLRFPVMHDPTWSVSKNKHQDLRSVNEPTELRRCVRMVCPPDLASWVPLPALASAARQAALKAKGEKENTATRDEAQPNQESPEVLAVCTSAFQKIMSLFGDIGVIETAKLINHLSYFYNEWQVQERVKEATKALNLNISGVPPQLLVGATDEEKALLIAAHKAAPLALQSPHGDSASEQCSSGWGEAPTASDEDGMPALWSQFPLPPVITASLPNAVPSGHRAAASKKIKAMPLTDAAKEFEKGLFGFPVPKDPTQRRIVEGNVMDEESAATLLRKYHNSVALSPRHHNAAMGVLFTNLAMKYVALSYKDLTPISLSLTMLAVSALSIGNVSRVRIPGFETQYLPLLLGPLAKDNSRNRTKGSEIPHVSRLELTAVSTALFKVDKLLAPEFREGDVTNQTFLPTVLKGLYRQASPMKQGVSWIRRHSIEHMSDLLWKAPVDAGTMISLMLDYDPSASMLLRENRVLGIADLMRYSHNFRIGQHQAPVPTPQAVKHQLFTHATRSIATLWIATAKSNAEEIPDALMHKVLGACVTPLLEGFFEEAYSDVVSLPAAVGRIQSGGSWAHQHIKQPHRDVADIDNMDVDNYVRSVETRYNCVVFLGAYLMSGDVYSRVGPAAYFALVVTLRTWMASVLTTLATARRLCALGASIVELGKLPTVTQQIMLETDPSFKAGLDSKLLPLTALGSGVHLATMERMHNQLVELLSPAPYRPSADSSRTHTPGIATHRNMHALLTSIPGEEKYTSGSTQSPPNPNAKTITTITSVVAVSAGTVARAVAGLRTMPAVMKAAKEAVVKWDGNSTIDAIKTTIDPLEETDSSLVEDDMKTVTGTDQPTTPAQTANKSPKSDAKSTTSDTTDVNGRSLAALCALALHNILGCGLGSVPSAGKKAEVEKELITKGISGIVKKLAIVCSGPQQVSTADLQASLVAIALLSSHSNTGFRQFLNLVSPQAPAKPGASNGMPNASAERYDHLRKHVLAAMSNLSIEALGAASSLKLITSEELAKEIGDRLDVANGSYYNQVRTLLRSDGILSEDTPSLQGNLNNTVDALVRAAFELRRDTTNTGYRALCEMIVEMLVVRSRYEYITASSSFVRRRLKEVQDTGVEFNPSDFEGVEGTQTKLGSHIHYAALEDLPFRIGLKSQHRPERQHFGTGAYMLIHCLAHYSFAGWYLEREAAVRADLLTAFAHVKEVPNTIPSPATAIQEALLNVPPSTILSKPPGIILRESSTEATSADVDLTHGLVPFNIESQIDALLWQDRRLICSTAARQAYLCGKALQNGHDRLLFWVGSLGDQLLRPVGASWCVGDIPLHCSAAKKSDEDIRSIRPEELFAIEGRDAASLQSLILQSIEAAQQTATVASFKRVAHAVALLNASGAHAEVGVSLLTIANRLYSDRKLFMAGAVYDYVVACSLHLSTIPNISLVLGHLRHEKLSSDEMKHVFRGITVAAENEAITSHHRATIVDLAKKALVSDSVSLQCATLRALAITRCGSSSVFRQLSALVVLKRHLLTVDEVGDAVSCAKYTDLADDVLSSGLREELVKRIPTMPWESTKALLPWMASAFIGDKELWTLVVSRYITLEGPNIVDPVLIASLCESANSDLAELPQHVASVASK